MSGDDLRRAEQVEPAAVAKERAYTLLDKLAGSPAYRWPELEGEEP